MTEIGTVEATVTEAETYAHRGDMHLLTAQVRMVGTRMRGGSDRRPPGASSARREER